MREHRQSAFDAILFALWFASFSRSSRFASIVVLSNGCALAHRSPSDWLPMRVSVSTRHSHCVAHKIREVFFFSFYYFRACAMCARVLKVLSPLPLWKCDHRALMHLFTCLNHFFCALVVRLAVVFCCFGWCWRGTRSPRCLFDVQCTHICRWLRVLRSTNSEFIDGKTRDMKRETEMFNNHQLPLNWPISVCFFSVSFECVVFHAFCTCFMFSFLLNIFFFL